MKITVDFMISGEVYCFVTIGWIPNCKANRPMKMRAFGDNDDDAFDAAMVKLMKCLVTLVAFGSLLLPVDSG